MASISCNNCSPPGTGIYARSEVKFVDVNRLQAHGSLVHGLSRSIVRRTFSFDRLPASYK